MSSIYLIGSLRNPKIPFLANVLRGYGHEVFDDWHSGGPNADDAWKDYEAKRGRTYREAIVGLAATNVFEFDMKHIMAADVGVLVLPAGKSAHLELGYMRGRGQQAYVLFEEEPDRDRWDLMYKLAHGVFFNVEELCGVLNKGTSRP
jgi:nucleoside 2-deoxyribosyltransferase